MTEGRSYDGSPVDLDAMMAAVVDKVRIYLPGFDPSRLMDAYSVGKAAHDGQLRMSGEP